MSKTQIETFKPPSADDPVLPEVVRRLAEVYHPLRIYLFGSAARGDAGPDSDYDLMVILPDEAPQHLRRGNPGYRALRGTGVAADVQVWPQGDFNRQLQPEGVISIRRRSRRETAVWSLTRSLSRILGNGFCAPRKTWTMRRDRKSTRL